jgi:nitrite reductase (NADH) small subunit
MSIATQLHQLGPIDRIPLGEARVYRVDGKDVAVFRCRTGEVFATSAECPHRGGPLADGLVGGHSVICPMHGFVFDLRTGEAPGRECERLARHRVSITPNGQLTLEMA